MRCCSLIVFRTVGVSVSMHGLHDFFSWITVLYSRAFFLLMADAGYFFLLEDAVFAFALSVVLAAVSWALMARANHGGDDPRELFRGALSGGLKVFLTYYVLIPALPLSGLSEQYVRFFSVLLVELSALLAIQLFSYIFTHLIRAHKEALALGIIGGITRSEAVTSSLSKLVKDDPDAVDTAVIVVITANATMLIRTLFLLLLIPVVGVKLFLDVLPPVLGMFLAAVAVIYYTYKNEKVLDLRLAPISVSMAVQIVLAFAIISALSVFAGSYGTAGYYAIAALGALSGALPVVLSMIALLAYKSIPITVAANIVLIAVTIGFLNDSIVALLFRQIEFFKKLVGKYALVLLGGFAGFVVSRGLFDFSRLPPYSFILLFLLFFIPLFAWFALKNRDAVIARTAAWGLFGALFNLFLFLVVLPLSPRYLFGLEARPLLYIIIAITLIELVLFLYTRLRKVGSLTALGFVAGIASAESLTFTLSKHGPAPAAKVVFAGKSSMFLRNLAILFALSAPLAYRLAPAFLLVSLAFLVLSSRLRTDESLAIKLSSLPSLVLLLLLLLFTGIVSRLSLDYLGIYGLYVSTALLSFTGLLPPMLSVVSLLSLGHIPAATALSLLSLSVLVACINDVVIARVFRAGEFSRFLLKKEVIVLVAGLLALYFA